MSTPWMHPGIRRAPSGRLQARVHVGSVHRTKTFSRGTPIADVRRWRAYVRAELRHYQADRTP